MVGDLEPEPPRERHNRCLAVARTLAEGSTRLLLFRGVVRGAPHRQRRAIQEILVRAARGAVQ